MNTLICRLYVRTVQCGLLGLNLYYLIGHIRMLYQAGDDKTLYMLAVSALAEQVGWTLLILWTFFRFESRTPILLASSLSMFTGNAIISSALWKSHHLCNALLNMTAGLLLCGFVMLAALYPQTSKN